jgi:potassium channel subfamily K
MIFLSYVAFGALLFSLTMSLTFLNGLFFTIVTTLTIGFGDIVPVTPAQRFATCFYAVFGIIILGAAVRLTTEAVLEGIEVGYRRRLQGYRKRRSERKRERQKVRHWRTAVEERLVERGLDVWTPDKPLSPRHPVREARSSPSRVRLHDPRADTTDALEYGGAPYGGTGIRGAGGWSAARGVYRS